MTKSVRWPEGSWRYGETFDVEDATRFVHDGYDQYALIASVDKDTQTDWMAVRLDELASMHEGTTDDEH